MGRPDRIDLKAFSSRRVEATRGESREAGGFSLWRFVVLATIGFVLLVASACSTSHYRESADKDVYESIDLMQKALFGESEDFTVDTRYSKREIEEIMASEIIQDRMEEGTLKLDLEGALQVAVAFSREYQTDKEALYLSALSLEGAELAFFTVFSGTSTGRIDREGDQSGKLSLDSNGTARKAFRTGGMITASLGNDLIRYFTGDPRRSLVNALSLNLTQPLLRGAGRSIAGNSLLQAERNLIYQCRTHAFFQNDFAVGVVKDYFTLLGAKVNLRNNYTNYLRSVQQRIRAESRAQFLGSPFDAQLARTTELDAKNAYIGGVANFQRDLDRFKLKLGVPLSVNVYLEDSDLMDLRQTGLPETSIDENEAIEVAVESYLPLLNEIDRYEDRKRNVRIKANEFLPGLDFKSDASLNWDDEENYVDFDVDDVIANSRLELDLPINRWKQRNDYRDLIIKFEAGIRTLARNLDDRRNAVANGIRALERNRNTYLINVEKQKNTKARLDEQDIKSLAGSVDQQEYIFAQNAYIQAQNAVTDSLVNVLSSKLDLQLNLGVLDASASRFWLDKKILETSSRREEPKTAEEIQMVPPHELFKENENTN